jgi:hypothetical protein
LDEVEQGVGHEHGQDDQWRDFRQTAALEVRFATEADYRAYGVDARCSDKAACARCSSTRMWTECGGYLLEHAQHGYRTSFTSGMVLKKTRKPAKMWFRAVFAISTRRMGISVKDLQRSMGLAHTSCGPRWCETSESRLAKSRGSGHRKVRRTQDALARRATVGWDRLNRPQLVE